MYLRWPRVQPFDERHGRTHAFGITCPEVLKRFSLEKVIGMWDDLLLKVAGNKLSFLS